MQEGSTPIESVVIEALSIAKESYRARDQLQNMGEERCVESSGWDKMFSPTRRKL
jgi:hypothetical protein